MENKAEWREGNNLASQLESLRVSGTSNSPATTSAQAATVSLQHLSPIDALDLLCPLSVLATTAHVFQPKASDVLWRTFTPIATGSYGRVSVGPFPKRNLNPHLTTWSGRVSRYPGEHELVTLKTPTNVTDPGAGAVDDDFEDTAENDLEVPAIPFRDMLPELALLSSPQILCHDNIVDLLGYFWEPHGSGSQDALLAPTLILEFADQGSLRTFLEFGPMLSTKERLGLCVDICRGLQTLHHEIQIMGKPLGICHWDLKPDNILVFKNSDGGGGYTAKLCDLGSCIRYDPQEKLPRGQAGAGTPGWKAPELASETDVAELISPAAADAYSFGILVAYVMLGKDLFRLEPVARFLFDNYFNVGSTENTDAFPTSPSDIVLAQASSDVRAIRMRLQDMIQQHTPTLLQFILEAVAAQGFSGGEMEAVVTVLEQTIQISPDARMADFAVLTAVLGGDPEENRHRTPHELAVDSLRDPREQMSIQDAISLAGLAATVMPEAFTSWFCVHLEQVFNHVSRDGKPEIAAVQVYLATLRGLLALHPGGTQNSHSEGVSWLLKATSFGDVNAAVLATRVAAALNQTIDGQDYRDVAGLLAQAAEDGSIIAQELTGTVPADDLVVTAAETSFHHRLLTRFAASMAWPQHWLAFMRKSPALTQLVKEFVDQGWDLERESLASIADVNGGFLTYAVPATGGSPLQWAVQMNNVAAVRVLVQAGASPYKGGRNAWSIAVAARLLPIIAIFADYCPCESEEERMKWTTEGLLCGKIEAYLACGETYVERSFAMFRYLFARSLVSREIAYLSTLNPGSADSRLLEKLLREDFSPETDHALLEKLLLHSVEVSNLEGVQLLLPLRGRLESTDPNAVCLLSHSIAATGRNNTDIFHHLLDHLAPDFNLDVRFTNLYNSASQPIRITDAEGMTLLHSAFSHGRTAMAIALLRRGADPTLETARAESPDDGLNAFGSLFFADTHHNYLALREFLASDYIVRETPTFVLDHAVVTRARRKTIFHFLCGDEQSRRHQSTEHMAALTLLKNHLRRLVRKKEFAHRAGELTRLVNMRMFDGGEDTMAPLHLAATSGFAEAIPVLVALGADPMGRVAADLEREVLGFTPLHVADLRDVGLWDEEWDISAMMLAMQGFPAMEKESPVARRLRAEYESRTGETVERLRSVMVKSEEGRQMWERRAAFLRENAE